MIDAVHHMLVDHHRTTALLFGWASWNVGMAVDTATGDVPAGILANLGISGLVIAAAWYMLRRSDAREASKDRARDRIESQLVDELRHQLADLQAENDRLRNRPPQARTRSTDN